MSERCGAIRAFEKEALRLWDLGEDGLARHLIAKKDKFESMTDEEFLIYYPETESDIS